jgi:hypothetical protein
MRTWVAIRMKPEISQKTVGLAASMLLLAACGGSSNFEDGGAPPANRAPTANAGTDQSVGELTTVNLSGSGSDPDGDSLSFSWTQTDGPSVSITNGTMASASFTAPDVASGSPETLTFQLAVSDGSFSTTDTVNVLVSQSQVLAGRLFYELPQPNGNCRGLDFNNVLEKPARRMTVLLLDAANNVVDTSVTGDDGSYQFFDVPRNTDVRIRVRAELVQSGAQSWEVYVRDNMSHTNGVPQLDQRPIYEVQWGLINTGGGSITDADFVARTGWDLGAGEYTGTRAAAPLAIADMILDGVLLIAGEVASVDMGRVDAFWSINNSWAVDPTTGLRDYDSGRIGTTHYAPDPEGDLVRNPALFLLGDAVGRFPDTVQVDTDEFDRGVVMHEWGHFFEDELSRSDSGGGRHVIPGTVEPRVAFSEGWGYGVGAIAAGDPVSCDTGEPDTTGGGLDLENNIGYGQLGFFNEMSVAMFLYDLFDTNVDGIDNRSIGFAPIYATMTKDDAHKDTEAFTTIFSFATELQAVLTDPADRDFVDDLLNRENIDTGLLNIWGDGQTTQPGGADFLPVYEDLPVDGTPLNICTNSNYDSDGDGNKPGEWRFLRFTTSGSGRWRAIATANPAPPPTQTGGEDRSDPDMWLYQVGDLLNICPSGNCQTDLTGSGVSGDPDFERMDTATLPGATYALAFNDWRFGDVDRASDYPSETCFTITMNPLP